MVWLIIFTGNLEMICELCLFNKGNCTQFGNAVKVKLFEIPFIGINCSEIKSEHEVTRLLWSMSHSYFRERSHTLTISRATCKQNKRVSANFICF